MTVKSARNAVARAAAVALRTSVAALVELEDAPLSRLDIRHRQLVVALADLGRRGHPPLARGD